MREPDAVSDHHHHHHAGGGAAVLDIGGDIGALVATMPAGAVGSELFLRPVDEPESTVHTGVWVRHDRGGDIIVAVFPELRAGIYDVLGARPDGAPGRVVEVTGGHVTTIDLRR
jgi:hypothetical protein